MTTDVPSSTTPPRPPLIALCARILTFSDEGKRDAFSSSQPYSRAIARAGGVPVLVPPIQVLADNALTVLQHFDGVLLPGGGDVNPRQYGQQPTAEQLYGIVDEHDELDLAVCRAAIELDLPMLALCRGMQVLNVALGGTLRQDIGNNDHWMREHPVELVDGSKFAQAAGTTDLPHCHSLHHQGLDRVADELVVTGYAPDGTIEAVELPSARWIIGAQWHPEDTASRDPLQQSFYDELIRQAGGQDRAWHPSS
ncbi:MAG TPA: gamma-glutamyl-gamma-aminobutyrate hydrolase family protein [Ilumatobacteraceae bacterium]|nr:gamma-glutamyl-gamma-aminobutyrate hydrolase family protein [Ilumatobacteraceae bacterium]